MIKVTKTIGNTDFNYKIITAGAKFALPTGISVTLMYNGRSYLAKMHSKAVGRIDGLAAFYRENNFQIGDTLTLDYEPSIGVIYVECENGFTSDLFKEPEEKMIPKVTGILETLEPVAFHHEKNYCRRINHMAVNGRFIFCNFDGEMPYLIDENGEDKVELSIEDELRYARLLGMNNKGVWFMKCHRSSYTWDDTEWYNEIVCVNIENDTQRRIKFNHKKGVIRDNPYIYGDNVYYVAKVTENKQELVWIDSMGTERTLYVAHKGEEIGCVSADDSRVAFYITTDKDNCINRWIVQKIGSGESVEIGILRDPDADWLPLVDIKLVDLKRNLIWTTMTKAESERYGADKWHDLVARPLEEPSEFKVLIYSKDHSPAIFKGAQERGLCYFDGSDAYFSGDGYELLRRDRYGKECLIGRFNHGESEKMLVNKSYVFVNYDAWTLVRLPRKFHSSEKLGADNPEAALIFGKKDYRL